MKGEAFGLVQAGFLSVGECQGGEVGVGGWIGEHPHRSRVGGWNREFAGEKPGKKTTVEMYINKISNILSRGVSILNVLQCKRRSVRNTLVPQMSWPSETGSQRQRQTFLGTWVLLRQV